MKWLLVALFLLIGLVLAEGLRLVFVRRPKECPQGTMRIAKSILYIGLVCGAFLYGIAVYSHLTDGGDFYTMLFQLFSMVGAYLILSYRNERVVYDLAQFTVTDVLGRCKSYRYAEITGIREELQKARGGYVIITKLYVGKCVCGWDNSSYEGDTAFERRVRQCYRDAYDGADIPVYVPKDLFRGNVDNAPILIGLHCVMNVVFIYFMIQLNDLKVPLILKGIPFLFWNLYFTAMVIVGRNPDRFPPKLSDLLFGKGTVRRNGEKR